MKWQPWVLESPKSNWLVKCFRLIKNGSSHKCMLECIAPINFNISLGVLDSLLSSDSMNTEQDSRWIIQIRVYQKHLEKNNRPIIDHLSDDDKLSTLTQKKAKLTRFGTQLKADYLSSDNTIDTVSFLRVPISFIKRFPHFRKKKLFVYKFFPSTRIKTRKYARPS